MTDRRDPDVHRMVMDWPDDAVAEIERLQARRAEAEDERDRMRRGWQHECESANLIGVHPINDNEHVGAYGEFEWEFRNVPPWLTVHDGVLGADGIWRGSDGILYGTPPVTGGFWAEARVHNLDDPYGVFSDWHPIQLTVNPTAEYLPIKAQFAAGVPVAYPLEGTGSCALSGAPAWVDVKTVPNGCIVMGRAPLDGEHYNFTMPGFRETGYPGIPIVFSGNVTGAYNFDPLPDSVGISGLAWHQVGTRPAVVTDQAGEMFRRNLRPPILHPELHQRIHN